MIPDAAVEAAARGMLANSNWGDRWDDLSDLHKGWWRAQATFALEAAAPHMLADAWEAGWKASSGWGIYIDMGGDEPNTDNPYKEFK